MTETTEGPGNPPPQPNLQATTEPTPTVRRSRWRWPETTRNRIAASVAIAAGTVAVVGAIFTSGVAVGAHAGGDGESHVQWGRHSAASAGRGLTPIGEVWIIPGDGTAGAPNGLIITGSESASMTNPR